jgi:hypothetical protein
MSGFWEGFEKRASSAGTVGTVAAGLAGGGLWKLLQKSKSALPGAGIHGHIGSLLRKAEERHPALGAGLTLGIPAAGGLLAGKAAHKLTKHLEGKFTSRTGRLKKHLSDITEKIKNYFGKFKREQPQQPK